MELGVSPRPRSVAETLLEVAADPQHLGAQIGFLAILHSWGQNLLLHPHLHCLVPVGGLSPDRNHWVRPRYRFFLPLGVLKKVFRGKFLDGLKRAYCRNKLSLCGATGPLSDTKAFRAFLQSLHRKNWIVYAKQAMAGPGSVLRYLGRYTHRVAISNHRLVSFDGEQITFRWKDYARGNKQRLMTLPASEFLRRYVQHVLDTVLSRAVAVVCLSRKIPTFAPSNHSLRRLMWDILSSFRPSEAVLRRTQKLVSSSRTVPNDA